MPRSYAPEVDVEAEHAECRAAFGPSWLGHNSINRANLFAGWLKKARTQAAARTQADAGHADTERLDWLEAHCTGASDSERYLPFRIYWGNKGATKGMRAQIDKARAETTTKPENT